MHWNTPSSCLLQWRKLMGNYPITCNSDSSNSTRQKKGKITMVDLIAMMKEWWSNERSVKSYLPLHRWLNSSPPSERPQPWPDPAFDPRHRKSGWTRFFFWGGRVEIGLFWRKPSRSDATLIIAWTNNLGCVLVPNLRLQRQEGGRGLLVYKR